jgi:hypothetical protein
MLERQLPYVSRSSYWRVALGLAESGLEWARLDVSTRVAIEKPLLRYQQLLKRVINAGLNLQSTTASLAQARQAAEEATYSADQAADRVRQLRKETEGGPVDSEIASLAVATTASASAPAPAVSDGVSFSISGNAEMEKIQTHRAKQAQALAETIEAAETEAAARAGLATATAAAVDAALAALAKCKPVRYEEMVTGKEVSVIFGSLVTMKASWPTLQSQTRLSLLIAVSNTVDTMQVFPNANA